MRLIMILPHLRIQNANAFSSPYTVGFPSITAWLGSVHAMQRILRRDPQYERLAFPRMGIVAHQVGLKRYKDDGMYLHSLIGMGTPIDRDGKRAAFIEEAKCDLDVSMLIDIEGLTPNLMDDLSTEIINILTNGLHIAGGDVLDARKPKYFSPDGENQLISLIRFLMPGYILVERRTLVKEIMETEQVDALDAILSLMQVCFTTSDRNPEDWYAQRKVPGWIVPISCGYQGISDFLSPGRERDSTTPHRFAESIITAGEFIMPYRINSIDEMLWKYRFDADTDLYQCINEQNHI